MVATLAKLRSRDRRRSSAGADGGTAGESPAKSPARLADLRLATQIASSTSNCRLDRRCSQRLSCCPSIRPPCGPCSTLRLLAALGAARALFYVAPRSRHALLLRCRSLPTSWVSLPSAPAPTSTFNNTWYAVGLSEQIAGDRLLGTQLWGEPMVVYRDAAGGDVRARPVPPPERAAVDGRAREDGVLRCFYHGWGFGAKGECVDVPTVKDKGGAFAQLACAQGYSVAERDGLLWVWRGETLAADAAAAVAPAAEPTVAVDTVLDYEADWAAVVEGLLDAPGATFEAPNVVRREHVLVAAARAVGGAHVRAPGRARVLMRQRLPPARRSPRCSAPRPRGAPGSRAAHPLVELAPRHRDDRRGDGRADDEGAAAPAAAAFATFGAAARAAEGGAGPAFARGRARAPAARTCWAPRSRRGGSRRTTSTARGRTSRRTSRRRRRPSTRRRW